ncbi:MAG: prepilin-type N-terminal cleavage/methylation domain-containing protein [Planctomycetes bacterium]|nr:prepilin-type N-terminal cleavage/methylation domain-containing protein [Planctomycetota bacterium]
MGSLKQQTTKSPRAGGFTLIELLTVMAILGILMGIGVGVFGKLNVAKFGAVSLVRNALRASREAAIASGLPVTVVCSAPDLKLYDLSVKPFGHWQFEDAADGKTTKTNTTSKGAFELEAHLNGATVGSDGRVGGALYLNKAGDHAISDLGGNAVYVFSNGVAVEADVYIDKPVSGNLLKRSNQFRLSISADGSVEAEVQLAEDETPEGKPAGSLLATSAPGVVLERQWARVGFVYDRVALVLYVDGIPLATRFTKGREPVARDRAPLEFGDKSGRFMGRLDGVKLGFVSPGEGVKLPKDVSFDFTGELSVHFLPDGRLDPAWHPSPVSVPLLFPENVKKIVTVGVYGTSK